MEIDVAERHACLTKSRASKANTKAHSKLSNEAFCRHPAAVLDQEKKRLADFSRLQEQLARLSS